MKKRIHYLFFIILLFSQLIACSVHDQPEPISDSGLISAEILRVVDGDTMKVMIDNKEDTVRLLLVDTPETVHPNKPVEPMGPEASDYAKKILSNQKVELEFDVSERDRYGRLLAYVWVGEKMFNEMLLEKGLARVVVYPPNVKYVDEFRSIQEKARKESTGFWSIENYSVEDADLNSNSDLISVTSPVLPGEDATLNAKVEPGAEATIRVFYKSGASNAAGLEAKKADGQGHVSWTWKVGSKTTPGEWKIEVSSGGETWHTTFIVANN